MLPELMTSRLILRETQLRDAPFLEAYQNSPEHWRLQAVEPINYADGKTRVEGYMRFRGEGADRRLYDFVGRTKDTNTLIGQVSIERMSPAKASIGFSVARDHRNQGFAAEMAERILSFGFDVLGLHRISADIAIENTASRHVVEKIGMTFEGVARDCIWAQGRWWSESKYAILKSDSR